MRKGTYSIVARDADSGELGVAVQSHWFSVGAVVTWGRPGVGVVATQSVAEPAYGPRTLDRLAAGENVQDALQDQVAADELARLRQVAAIATDGSLAVHTGADCIPHAGHVEGGGFSCQANMMAGPGVPEAMAAAFEGAEGDLAGRLLAALEGADAAGGDVRGRQSAAMLVVGPDPAVLVPVLELRVEDHADPVAELGRLLELQRAYALAGEADEQLGAGEAERAGELYVRAAELAPESDELLFWAGLSLAHTGDLDAGVAAVRRAAAVHPGWLELLDRLTEEFAPAGAAVRAALAVPEADSGLKCFPPEREAVWCGLLAAHTELTRGLDAALSARHGLSLSAYEVLSRLAHAENGHLRMTELAARSQLSLSRVSRVLDGLEERGLAARRSCPSDSRVVHATILGAGRELVACAQDTFFAAVEERFLGRLSPAEIDLLGNVFARLHS